VEEASPELSFSGAIEANIADPGSHEGFLSTKKYQILASHATGSLIFFIKNYCGISQAVQLQKYTKYIDTIFLLFHLLGEKSTYCIQRKRVFEHGKLNG
jgi:hypothetical protein